MSNTANVRVCTMCHERLAAWASEGRWCPDCQHAYDHGRAATLAEVCAWLRGNGEHPAMSKIADAIERGDTRPRGEGSQKS